MVDYREKRNGRRVPIDCQVDIEVQESMDRYQGIIRNLSVDGILIESEYNAETGKLLEVNVVPPTGSTIMPLHALVEVTRSTPTPMGDRYEIAGAIKEIKG